VLPPRVLCVFRPGEIPGTGDAGRETTRCALDYIIYTFAVTESDDFHTQ